MPSWRPVTVDLLRSRSVQEPSGCLVWTGSRNEHGYGQVSRDGRPAKVHRVMVELVRGLRSGDVVMHTCDNPPCINPDHLVVSTQDDNVRDMFAKHRDGRSVRSPHGFVRGSRVGTAVLNEGQVATIKRDLANGGKHRTLARAYGVSRSTIKRIATGEHWRHVDAA